MILGEAIDVVVERVEPRRRNDPRLPHRAAEAVLLDACAAHQLVRAGDQRAERAAEPLGEAERDRVDERCAISAAGVPDATAAFMRRAPSR